MIYSIYHILTTTNPNLISLKWTLILAIILLLLLIYRSLQPKTNSEGFQQKEPFVMKRNEDTMDMFYAELYDSLHDVSRRADSELIHIINTTSPSTNQSVFLDVVVERVMW